MKNDNYSLTAKERKELRKLEREAVKKSTAPSPEISEEERAAAKAKKRNRTFLIVVGILLAVVFAATGILFAFFLNRKPEGDPLATITFVQGGKEKKVTLQIFESKAPIAATNFMFLSLKKYFDKTIVHDNQNNWVRFGGYVSNETHRSDDDNYCKGFSGFNIYSYDWAKEQTDAGTKRNIFYYRLNSDTTATAFKSYQDNKGVIGYLYSSSSSMFQISTVHGANIRINGTDQNFTVFGQCYDEESYKTLEELNVFGTDLTKTTQNGPWFNPNDTVTIKNIKISNYDKDKWKEILKSFDTKMEELKGYYRHQTTFSSIS